MTLKFFEKLSTDFTKLLNNNEDYDVAIEVGEAPLNKVYKLHSLILKTRCPLFADELKEIKDNGTIKQLRKPNISFNVFDIIVKYIYGAIVSLNKLEKSIVFDLLVAANSLNIEELIDCIQLFLIENNSNWLRLNFPRVLRASFENSKLEKLKEFCNNIISKHPSTVFNSDDFVFLPEDVLVSVLKNDNLQVEESQIWDHVIQWGKAKNETLPTSLNEWSTNDFATLKNTLQKLLPHVRYFQIPNKDLFHKVRPYLQAFDPKLWDDIVCNIMDPNHSISSTILPPRTSTDIKLPSRKKETEQYPRSIVIEPLPLIEPLDDSADEYQDPNYYAMPKPNYQYWLKPKPKPVPVPVRLPKPKENVC